MFEPTTNHLHARPGLAADSAGSARVFRAKDLREDGEEDDIANYRLHGIRRTGPIRVIALQDLSGSMHPYAVAREEALKSLVTWSRRNLRSEDELGVIDFSDRAGVALPVTPISKIDTKNLKIAVEIGGTSILPAIELSKPWWESSSSIWFVALSDGEIFDALSPVEQQAFRGSNYGGTILINPSDTEMPGRWTRSFPDSELVCIQNDTPGAIAVGIGQAISIMTQQRLVGGTLAFRLHK